MYVKSILKYLAPKNINYFTKSIQIIILNFIESHLSEIYIFVNSWLLLNSFSSVFTSAISSESLNHHQAFKSCQ